MGLDVWIKFVTRHRQSTILIALVSTFAGIGLLIDRPKGSILEWLSIPFLLTGVALFVWTVWPRSLIPAQAKPSLAGKLVNWITAERRLVAFFPALGGTLLAADLAFNVLISVTPNLGTEDIIVVLLAATLLVYNVVPRRYARERDFAMVFFLALNAILVVPIVALRAFYQDFNRSVDVYSWIALAPETSAVLSLLGVSNSVHTVPGATAPGLTFVPVHLNLPVTVVITTSCSGIYSFGIFASGFVSFVLTEYQQASKRIWCLLGLGFLASYLANVMRMVVIVLVGYYTDTVQTDLQNMLVAHSYAGWIIFLAWIALFWGVLVKYLPGNPVRDLGEPSANWKTHGTLCGICHDLLTPAVPATRCSCGAYYHLECVMPNRQCTKCNSSIRSPTIPHSPFS